MGPALCAAGRSTKVNSPSLHLRMPPILAEQSCCTHQVGSAHESGEQTGERISFIDRWSKHSCGLRGDL